MDCIFCKIAAGEIPSTTLYEDDQTRIILDINPAAAGHALILPKKHFRSLLEADEETLGHVFALAAKLGNRMEEALGCDGVNVIANCREGAGQTIDHFHVHVIPRYKNQPEKDALIISQSEIEKPDFEELQSLLSL